MRMMHLSVDFFYSGAMRQCEALVIKLAGGALIAVGYGHEIHASSRPVMIGKPA